MNKPIRTVSIFCLVLFLSLMGKATYIQFFQAASLNDRADNRRVKEYSYSTQRGAILVGNTAIASSKASGDKFEYLRTYQPNPEVYAPVTGYFSFGSSTGIEASENSVLTGDDPSLFVPRLMDLINNRAQRGGNVKLTLDPQAQLAAYRGLLSLGDGVEGSVVAIQPSTGRILAMASVPSYDPNKLASHDFDAVAKTYTRLDRDAGDPLVNRAIRTRLFPGSTFKVVTAAAALEKGLYSGADDLVPGGATFQLPLTRGDSGLIDNEGRDCGSGDITFRLAMENSCNTSFAQIAIKVGAEGMLEQAEKFGFNSDYFDDLQPGQVQSVFPTQLDKAQLGQVGFGQFDVQATPLQMAMVAAGIANDGTVMKPHVLDEVQTADYDGHKVENTVLTENAVSPSTADVLTQLLVSTVDNGTASPAAIPGVEVAGKTGTAQSGVPGKPPYAWFLSFAPAQNAQVAVAVMIQKAPRYSADQIAGGQLGGPIAKAVMEAVLKR